MVDYNELLKLAKEAFPRGTEYTGILYKNTQISSGIPTLSRSITYKCKAIKCGPDWVWVEKIGWCKEFNPKEKLYELW